ncbi:class I SAM-dependent methyltransferase [Pseudoalteromonas luteoviolacea]|uniref:Methyltransferase domain protein n=1 Tax=Pseudoalteromonas luteoviolacea (strain 2ta16) TaxID=1353533 RepID=V4HSU3_PSEL2|nr:class I SAM-dependent methyltransferase [Pseudoalteromonas luteoviolacea]ESP91004.1 methyltransferase domain protein [Pseudoalteromonas luteoviolacea 2ta16]KZN38238.1 hypothetical protein N483_19995 [Pseudoalteromonas luteoviolacea NCIMB 1944]
MVAGTIGYERDVLTFAKVSFALEFEYINKEFLPFLPGAPARVLDAGCGVGQNSAALFKMGYDVVAVEPLGAFLEAAKLQFPELEINWQQDSLPDLKLLTPRDVLFDFILMDGVWHHLNYSQRKRCIDRLSNLLSPGGVCAISLRNGPAGKGTHIFPTSCNELFKYAKECGLEVVFHVEDQPSKMPNKHNVTWSRVALRK